MSKQSVYDLFKRPNGLMYRVSLRSPLHEHAEFYHEELREWLTSAHKVGGFISSNSSVLVARNVVFKDSVCSQ